MKALVLGAYGMLGHDLQAVFPGAILCGHRDLDVSDEGAVHRYLSLMAPDLVINAAAYTDVEGCEDHRDLAFSVNGDAPGYIATACADIGAELIHYSTDYVFDGAKGAYVESDLPHPINVYGESKLLGERRIFESSLDDFRIIRASWLFGKNGKNFVETMLRLSREMPLVKVVNDQFGKPTYTRDLARKTAEIVGFQPGIYHITNEGVCSWYEFAQAIIPNVAPCTTEEFPRKAKRPESSALVNTKTKPLRHWKEALDEYLRCDHS